MQTVLTIAGFDPSSGAGVTADLMVFAAHGLFGTACITALTVQLTLAVESVHATPSEVVDRTLLCLEADLAPAGIKIGMLGSAGNILSIIDLATRMNLRDEAVKEFLPIVLDPVFKSSSGTALNEPEALATLQGGLLPLVSWITPNLSELGILAQQTVERLDDLPGACHRLQRTTSRARGMPRLGIIATGGHLDRPDDYVLMPSGEGFWLRGERVETTSTHGTGCAFSSAFLSRLVLGQSAEEAAAGAKRYVSDAMRSALPLGSGNGPLNLFGAMLLKVGRMSLSITINGQSRVFPELDSPSWLSAVVAALELKADRIAVEHNGEIAGRGVWAKTTVAAGDRLEIVHFVGGGAGMVGAG